MCGMVTHNLKKRCICSTPNNNTKHVVQIMPIKKADIFNFIYIFELN